MDEDLLDEDFSNEPESIENSDLIRDIISLGVDAYPERNIDSSDLIIIIPFGMLESVIEVLKYHKNDQSIIWHGSPLIDSRIEFIIPGYSFLPIKGLIRPGPLVSLIQDYYDVIYRKDSDAFNRLNTELTNSTEFSISSSANYGIDSLIDNIELSGEIKMILRFDNQYYQTFNRIMEDKDYIFEIPPDEENLIEENADNEFENLINQEAEEEENYLALLEETFLAQQSSNKIEDNYDALINETIEANTYNYNDYLDDNIVGFGVGSSIKNKSKLIKDFDRNITNLIHYYPDHSKIARLVEAKQKILTFLRKSFK